VAAPIARSLHPASRRYSPTIRALLRVIGLPVAIVIRSSGNGKIIAAAISGLTWS
jgi:hypothetical protein